MATEKQSMLQNGKSCTLNHPPVSTETNTSSKASDVGLGIRNQIPCKPSENSEQIFFSPLWKCMYYTHTWIKLKWQINVKAKHI